MERVIVRHIVLIIIIVIMFLLLIFNAKYNDTKLLYHHDSNTYYERSMNAGSSAKDHMFYEQEITKKMSSDISGLEEPDVSKTPPTNLPNDICKSNSINP